MLCHGLASVAGSLDGSERRLRWLVGAVLVLIAWASGFDGVEGIGALVLGVAVLATAAWRRCPARALFARAPTSATVARDGSWRALIADPRMAVPWLAARLWVGEVWFQAGWSKLDDSAWVGARAPAAIHGFLTHATEQTSGAHPQVSTWYAWLIEHAFLPLEDVLTYAVPIGELLVGVGLILGLLTAPAAVFSALLAVIYLLAGSTGAVLPIVLVLSLALLAAGPVASAYGLDRVVGWRLREHRGRRTAQRV